MDDVTTGDLVRRLGGGHEMLAIGRADDQDLKPGSVPTMFCAWEEEHELRVEVFPMKELELVRSERRRVPRGGELQFPVKQRVGDSHHEA
jgi:hypothetical protein